MTAPSTTEWNPKWLDFLSQEGLSTDQAGSMTRPERISLNAKFMCWNMARMSPERKKLFFS